MMPKPKIYRDPHPFATGSPGRARMDGLSWLCRTWQEALEKTAVHLHTRRAARTNGAKETP